MRTLVLAFAAAGLLMAQRPTAPLFQFLMGRLEDLKVGRDVFVIGLKLPIGKLEATRIIVYEGHTPVRMKLSRIMPPNGAAH